MNTRHPPLPAYRSAPPRWRRPRHSFTDFLVHLRRRWYLYLPIATIWGLAYTRLFVDPTPHLPVLFNWSTSLPYRVALVRRGAPALQRGDYIVFAFAGDAQTRYPGLHRQPFFKIVRGLPGDTISVTGRVVSINGDPVGVAKTHGFDHQPLDPIRPTTIPAGHYYVQGTGADSFDSRYRSSGLVRSDQVLGTLLPLF